jgi:aryl-alcohol dehydrogenase-like predicted oxidoreductase
MRNTAPRFQKEAFEANMRMVDRVRELADKKGCTPGQLALAWVHAQGPDVFPIPGTKRIKYLEASSHAFGGRPPSRLKTYIFAEFLTSHRFLEAEVCCPVAKSDRVVLILARKMQQLSS